MFRKLVIGCFGIFFLILSSNALTRVDITRSNASPLPIAIMDFDGSVETSEQIRNVIKNDLEGTGLFRVIPQDAYIEKPDFTTSPTFASWRQIDATTLVTGAIRDGVIEVKLWDVFSQEKVSNLSYKKNSVGGLRKIAHKIADEVYNKLTGEKPYFNTSISYVHLQKKRDGSEARRIAMMDQDGFNHKYLTDGKDIVLTPRFSPSTADILYLAYKNSLNPKVYNLNVQNKSHKKLGDFTGMSYAPRYVDSSNALLAVSKNGVSNIYKLNMKNMKKKQLTFCSSICTSPSSSPDKKKIVFNSDMGGSKQLYVMDSNGKNIERISFNEGSYSSPIWSPRGDLIAFTKMLPGKGFFIGVMRPDGSGERLITRGWLVDSANWAPNGRVLMFEKEAGPGKGKYIYTIDITGNNERRLNTPGQASDPSWSRNIG